MSVVVLGVCWATMPTGKDPTEDAQAGALAPTVSRTFAEHAAKVLDHLARQRHQQVQRQECRYEAPHDRASASCSTVGDPAKPAGVEKARQLNATCSPPSVNGSRPSTHGRGTKEAHPGSLLGRLYLVRLHGDVVAASEAQRITETRGGHGPVGATIEVEQLDPHRSSPLLAPILHLLLLLLIVIFFLLLATVEPSRHRIRSMPVERVAPTVVAPCRPWVSVTGRVLDVLEWYAGLACSGDERDPQGMRADLAGAVELCSGC